MSPPNTTDELKTHPIATLINYHSNVLSTVRETVFDNGSDYFSALLKDIQNAKNSVSLETYIYDTDHLGDQITEALEQAARRGVHVRVLVDGAGSPFWTTSYAKPLEAAGARTRVFHPFPWQLWNWSRAKVKLPWVLKLLYLLIKCNTRNHRKVCIIDDRVAYLGSINISKCHLNKQDGGDGWRDTAIKLTGLDLTGLSEAYTAAWSHRSIKERLRTLFQHIRQDPPIRLNHSRHRRRLLHKALIRRVRNCKHRVWITNAYFVPDHRLLNALKEAANNGVDVRILLPKKSDLAMMPWATSTFYYNLIQAGVRIFEYLPSMLHAKSLIIDQWATVGSTNLNHRSLLHDLEADVRISLHGSQQQLERMFLNDLTQSRELDLRTWYRMRPRRHRLLGRLVLYLKYWI